MLERYWVLLCFVSNSIVAYFFFAFALISNDIHLPGSGLYVNGPTAVTTKYVVDIFPNQILLELAWPVVLGSNIFGQLYLYKMVCQMKVFPEILYKYWMCAILGTFWWCYGLDREQLTSCVFVVGALNFIYFSMVVMVIKRANVKNIQDAGNSEFKRIPGAKRFFFYYLVIGGIALTTAWVVVAQMSTIAYAIKYKYSFGMEPILRGLVSSQAAGTIGLMWGIIAEAVWIYCDLVGFPQYTGCVKTVYPFLTFALFGTFGSNYHFDTGLSFNNIICLVMALCSLLAFIFRDQFHAVSNGGKKHE